MSPLGNISLGSPKIFDAFGFGTAMMCFLVWRHLTIDIEQTIEKMKIAQELASPFPMLVTGFLLFLAYVVGQFIAVFGKSIWFVFNGKSSVAKNIENLLRAVHSKNERIWAIYQSYESRIRFFNGILGFSFIILIRETTSLFSKVTFLYSHSIILLSFSLSLMAFVRIRILRRELETVLLSEEIVSK